MSEALTHRTAIGDVMRLIGAHPGDVRTVLNAIVAKAAELCDAESAVVMLRRDSSLEVVAVYGDRMQSAAGEVMPIRSGVVSPLPTELRRPTFRDDFLAVVKVPSVALLSMRSTASVPLVHDNEWIGDLQLYRHEIRPFDEKLAPMLAAFADQAAIAVVNSKLLNDRQEINREVTAALEQQRGSRRSPRIHRHRYGREPRGATVRRGQRWRDSRVGAHSSACSATHSGRATRRHRLEGIGSAGACVPGGHPNLTDL